MDCLNHYIAASDPGVKNDYLLTDLLYASRKYDDAITHAQQLIADRGESSEPRLYKLIAYSYKEKGDSAKALEQMQEYFKRQKDTSLVAADFETMGEIYIKFGNADSAAEYLAKAGNMEKDSLKQRQYAKKLAALYKDRKDYSRQARWLEKYYVGNDKATNLDLFNWGLAHYMAKEYPLADSVFNNYEIKYPDQDFGYYWSARSAAAIDTAMTEGIAIPHYLKLVDIAEKDTANKTNRKHLFEAYGYIAAYKANARKDYAGAIEYFEKLLTLDPGNKDAQHYIDVLKKNLARSGSKPASSAAANSATASTGQDDNKTAETKTADSEKQRQ
jgi:tetratricopeptide (TPR) repeat protein